MPIEDEGGESCIWQIDTATGVTVCLCMHAENDSTLLSSERAQLGQGLMIRKQRDGGYLCIALEQSLYDHGRLLHPPRKPKTRPILKFYSSDV